MGPEKFRSVRDFPYYEMLLLQGIRPGSRDLVETVNLSSMYIREGKILVGR